MATVLMNFSLRPSQAERLNLYAERHGMKKSHVIGRFIERFCNLESCTDCTMRFYYQNAEKIAQGYSVKEIQKIIGINPKTIIRPAFVNFYRAEPNTNFLLCVECSDLADDEINDMLTGKSPRVDNGTVTTLLTQLVLEDFRSIRSENILRNEKHKAAAISESSHHKRQTEKSARFDERENAILKASKKVKK